MNGPFTITSQAFKETWEPEPGRALQVYMVGLSGADGQPVTDETGQPISAQMMLPPDAGPPEVGRVLNDRILNKNKRGYSLKKQQQPSTPQVQQQEQQIAEQTFGVTPSQTLPAQSAPMTIAPTGNVTQISSQPPSDPRQESIVRQHSEEMALRTLAIMVNLGMVAADTTPDKLKATIKAWTDWFVADAFGREQG